MHRTNEIERTWTGMAFACVLALVSSAASAGEEYYRGRVPCDTSCVQYNIWGAGGVKVFVTGQLVEHGPGLVYVKHADKTRTTIVPVSITGSEFYYDGTGLKTGDVQDGEVYIQGCGVMARAVQYAAFIRINIDPKWGIPKLEFTKIHGGGLRVSTRN